MYRKQFRDFLIALGIGLSVGTLYVLPLAIYFGDPLYTLHTYTSRDYGAAKLVGPHGHLFGWPSRVENQGGERRERANGNPISYISYISLLCCARVQPYVREISSSLAATHFKRFLESDRYTR